MNSLSFVVNLLYIITGLIAGDKVIEVASKSEAVQKAMQVLNNKLDELANQSSGE